MSWIGKKKIAFIPVYRPSVDSPPSNWTEQILRRIYFDPAQPGVDKSLRSYISTTSYGMADLEGHVLPIVELDQQENVPVNALARQYEKSLRNQGFDAAALVMLGGVGASNAQPSGFWARFVMAEGVGVWAMELLHVLTGYRDFYLKSEYPRGFDNMACNLGTHFSAYAKQKFAWLDPSSIRKHFGRTAQYHLHTLGLVQPSPAGMTTAVQVGENANFLMVEARQKVDQFDSSIPSEGVIVYEVLNPDKYASSLNVTQPSIQYRTQEALKPGQRFISSSGVAVQVNSALENGFSIRIDDTNVHVVDRSGEVGAPNGLDGMVPTACVIPGLGIYSITYCDYVPERPDRRHHLHSLWRDSLGAPHWTDLTEAWHRGLNEQGVKNPLAYVDTTRNMDIVLWNSNISQGVGDVWCDRFFRSTGRVGHRNLTRLADHPAEALSGHWHQAVGYYNPANDVHHVFYIVGPELHVHELWWIGNSRPQYGGDLTALASAPSADHLGSAFIDANGYNVVTYCGHDDHIHSLYWKEGAGPVGHDNLSHAAGTPRAKLYPFRPVIAPYYSPDPVAYYTPHNGTHQVVYRGEDDHLYELYWAGVEQVRGWDLTNATNGRAPVASYGVCNFTAFYNAKNNTKHVIYVTDNNQLHDIWWIPEPGHDPGYINLTLTFGAPPARGRPAAFSFGDQNTQHVAFRGSDNHIYELIW